MRHRLITNKGTHVLTGLNFGSLSLNTTIAHKPIKRHIVSLKMAIINDIISIYVSALRHHRLTFNNIENDDVRASDSRSKIQRIVLARKIGILRILNTQGTVGITDLFH